MEATGSDTCYLYHPAISSGETYAQGSQRSSFPCASRTCGRDRQRIRLLFLKNRLEVPGWYLWHPLTIVSVFDFETCEIALSHTSENFYKRNAT